MKNKAYASLAVLLCFLGVGWSQNPSTKAEPPQPTGFWKDIPEVSLPKTGRDAPLPQKFRLLEMDVAGMKALLESVRDQALAGRGSDQPINLTVPMPDGSYRDFAIRYDPVMHPELAAKFPEIMSFSGTGTTGEKGTTLHFAFSQIGFHALVYPLEGDHIFVEPVQKLGGAHYICFFERDRPAQTFHFGCGVGDGMRSLENPQGKRAGSAGDCQLRTYRLALGTTAEYTATFIGAGDPTGVTNTLSALNALITAINGVFLREFTIRLELVANNNSIIFTDAITDGYTDGNTGAMASDGENQNILDLTIGAGNYDIGHAFGVSPFMNNFNGLSEHIGNVCANGNKANAASVMNPTNPQFSIRFIMHEFGHQFGTHHTFNDMVNGGCASPGQFNSDTAYEPGSGSTIMSYQGSCGTADVPAPGGQYFHTVSLQRVGSYVTSGTGSTCPVTTALANSAPTVSAGPASYTIPISTPFRLRATASDVDGNFLTYCWEQFDNQSISHPPASTATEGPVFRSFPPTTSPIRYCPNLPDLLAGNPTPWEVLPSVSRTLNFIVTVRDNATGGGCTDEDNIAVIVSNTSGPFTVNPVSGPEPNCLLAEDNATITWNVAGTTAPPVSCANVDILLSLDGGNTFSVVLANNTPNDGSQSVFIPATAVTTQGRIMVMASNNIFFNVNNADLRIDCPDTHTVTDNPAIGTYKSRNLLITSGTVIVPPFATTRFYAANEIRLRPGFWAQAGCDFLARIQPCNPCVANKTQDLAAPKENPRVNFYEVTGEERVKTAAASVLKARVFPNPFNQNFTLQFEMPETGQVDIQLFDITGRAVLPLFEKAKMEAGPHEMSFDTSNLGNGVYECHIQASGHRALFRLIKMD